MRRTPPPCHSEVLRRISRLSREGREILRCAQDDDRMVSARLLPLILLLCQSAAEAPKPPAKDKYQAFAMTHPGDVGRGRKLFLDEQRLACARCHTTDGTGGRAGPDLFAIGDKFGRRELIEAVLSPSATIAVGYSTTVVKTKSGETYAGVVKDANDA